MYKEIPHFHAFLFFFPVFPVFWACRRETEWARNEARSGRKGESVEVSAGLLVLLGGVRGEYGFSEVLPLFPVRGGGTCPAANEKCHRGNIKKEQKVEFPVPYTWGICPESGGSGSGIFFRAGHSLVFVVGVAAAGAVGVIPFCPLLHSALWKKRWVPPLRRSMFGNEIHCALSRADR